MDEKDFCYEYEQVLLERRENYSSELFNKKSREEQDKIAIQFLKAVFEKYFHWTPEQVYHYLNKDIIEKMKLSPIVYYLNFDIEFNINSDCYLIAYKLYPDYFKISKKELAVITYQRVLDGSATRFPKNFFLGTDGQLRAKACLVYALNTRKGFSSIDEIFKFMYEEGLKFLKESKLWDAYYYNYNTSPIDFFYDCLSKEMKEKYKEKYEIYESCYQAKKRGRHYD